MISITANQKTAKNLLASASAWLNLVEFKITGIKTLDYDAEATAFSKGAVLTGDTSGATAKIIDVDDQGSTGTLILWDVQGTFQNNETIEDSEGGEATEDGTIQANDITYRFALNTEDVSWNSLTWLKAAIKLDLLKQTATGRIEKLSLGIAVSQNDALNLYFDLCNGLEGSLITLRMVVSTLLGEAAVTTEEYLVEEGGRSPGGEWILFSLGHYENERKLFPGYKYERTPCRYQFPESNTCQYGGADTSCLRDLAACVAKANEGNFGAFPAIPGGSF